MTATYSVKLFMHKKLDGLQAQINHWLETQATMISTVVNVSITTDRGVFYYAALLYQKNGY